VSFAKDVTSLVVLGVSFAGSLFLEGACLFRCSWFPFHHFHGLRLERNNGPRLLCAHDACVSFLQSVVLCFLVDDSYAPIVLDIFSLLLTFHTPHGPCTMSHSPVTRFTFVHMFFHCHC
ncbi:uncharacterized protein EV420DRAFT_1574193, partial [Desarmillaria tabescens]